MRQNFLNITGATILTKKEQQQLNGGIVFHDAGKCGCDCAGRVTGPIYCQSIMACPQVYTCDEVM